MALKCDLAGQLIGRDDARAGTELERLLEVAARAETDIRSVTAEGHRLSLAAELEVAHEVLASAGIAVEVRA